MPQMAPLLWLNLYVFFILIFISFIILNYFIKLPPKTSASSKPAQVTSILWKW
uniref:ATP synthase complex subunit 8 n=1 Tax=Palaemon capensis TaxID=1440474 RepID=A0A385JG25_9EUCA|nr:ATP synthase F0 subunit 8 [Palaemon capensis]AXY96093.1 ATP synthase F0 subunit 8 [Palaemon capensis]